MFRINLQMQFFLGLLLALLLGWIYETPLVVIEQEALSVPLFKDLSGGWRVEVRFSKDKPPEILEVQVLEEIRLTPVSNPGDYLVAVLDKNGQELYSQKFNVYFMRTGSSLSLDVVDMTLILPFFNNVSEIVIRSPQGEVHHVISEQ